MSSHVIPCHLFPHFLLVNDNPSFREIEKDVADGRRTENVAPVFGQMLVSETVEKAAALSLPRCRCRAVAKIVAVTNHLSNV